MGLQQAGEQSSLDIVARSRTLLTQCKKVIYFANGASLTSRTPAQKRQRTGNAVFAGAAAGDEHSNGSAGEPMETPASTSSASTNANAGASTNSAGDIVVDEANLQTLASRFDFLNEVLPEGVDITQSKYQLYIYRDL